MYRKASRFQNSERRRLWGPRDPQRAPGRRGSAHQLLDNVREIRACWHASREQARRILQAVRELSGLGAAAEDLAFAENAARGALALPEPPKLRRAEIQSLTLDQILLVFQELAPVCIEYENHFGATLRATERLRTQIDDLEDSSRRARLHRLVSVQQLMRHFPGSRATQDSGREARRTPVPTRRDR